MWTWDIAALGVIGLIVLLCRFIAEVVWCRRTLRIRTRPVVEEGQIDLLPGDCTEFTESAARLLAEVGFEIAAHLNMPRYLQSLHVVLVLLVNPTTRDRASILCCIEPTGNLCSLVLVTEFSDGLRIQTSDREVTSQLHSNSEEHVAGFPGVDPRSLFQLHRQHVQRVAPDRTDAMLPLPGTEVDSDIDRHVRVLAEFLAPHCVQRGEWFIPTWRTAVQEACSRFWPLRFFWRGSQSLLPTFPVIFPVLSKRGSHSTEPPTDSRRN